MLSLLVLRQVCCPLSTNAKVAILHGAAQYCLTDKEGQIAETHSLSAGLDYPGESIHGLLKTLEERDTLMLQIKRH